jgi:predicted phage baseplate assembly protein
VDAATGRIAFGDGERGRALPPTDTAFAHYRVTAAQLGNVLAGSITVSPVPGIGVTNLVPASGGAAQEDLVTAAGRAVSLIYSHDPRSAHPPTNAVNLEDYERLAIAVPFTRVARARAYANVNDRYACLRATGVVTVVILPDMAVPKPVPSPELIRAVWRHLDERRTICTQVRVTGPQYLEIRVNAQVTLLDAAAASSVVAEIRRRLDGFLDPRTGGPDGSGWPFGRAVYRSEILSLIDDVPGVDHVDTLEIQAGDRAASCGNVMLCPGWLATAGPHRIQAAAR